MDGDSKVSRRSGERETRPRSRAWGGPVVAGEREAQPPGRGGGVQSINGAHASTATRARPARRRCWSGAARARERAAAARPELSSARLLID